MVDIQSATGDSRRGKKMKKKEEATAAKYNGLPYWAAVINARSLLVTWMCTRAKCVCMGRTRRRT